MASTSGDHEIVKSARAGKQLLGGHLKLSINQSAIGIRLVGNFEQTLDRALKQRKHSRNSSTRLQRDVLRKRTRWRQHKELPGEKTVCPGKYFSQDTPPAVWIIFMTINKCDFYLTRYIIT